MNRLLDKLKIDETFTKPIRQPKVFNKVKANVPLIPDYNFMADLLFLPTSKQGYKYLLVMVDLANDEFDIEPITNKESTTVLKAMKAIFKRGILKKPYASIRTDAGSEFKGVFHKYLHDENIMQKIALPNRHTQLANVESLNRTLGRLLNGYMNSKELEFDTVYKEWPEVLGVIRKDLNDIRRKKVPKDPVTHTYPIFNSVQPVKTKRGIKMERTEPKYKVGDWVYRLLDYPKSALGVKQSGTFRQGDFRYDTTARKIKQVLYYAGKVPYRYIISGIPNASYAQSQLLEETADLKKLIPN